MSKTMFDKIKRQNGEHFAKSVRNYDNGIFDIPNLDDIVKYAGSDAEPIMNYLISLKGISIQELSVHQNPITLLKKAGYNAYIADTLEKQNAIQKYFAPGEELCTFDDKHRYEHFYIINAVHEDADKIKHAKNPERQDEYGTSVISIQVRKSGGFISIKNRYNHTVLNPDNTFYSNPDNIIFGLSDAIKHYFNVDFSSRKEILPDGYIFIDNQICKQTYEQDGIIYVLDSAYVKNGVFYTIDKNSEILLPYLGALLNMKKHEIIFLSDSRVSSEKYHIRNLLRNIVKNSKITVSINIQDNTKQIYLDGKLFIRLLDNKECFVAIGKEVLYLDRINTENNKNIQQHSNLEYNHIEFSDFSLFDLKLNYVAEDVYCVGGYFKDSILDFSNVKKLFFKDIILDNSKVIFNQNAEQIYLTRVTGLSGCIDFSNVKDLQIKTSASDPDMADVQGIRLPQSDADVRIYDDAAGSLRNRLQSLQDNFNKYKNLKNLNINKKIGRNGR